MPHNVTPDQTCKVRFSYEIARYDTNSLGRTQICIGESDASSVFAAPMQCSECFYIAFASL